MFHIKRKRARAHEEAIEIDNLIRLESAERDIKDLQQRGSKAIDTLDERARRNHWRESIEQMIQGA